MAAPNLVNPSSITSKTATLAPTTSPTAIISNAAASGKVVRVTALIVTNLDAVTQYYCTADLYSTARTPNAMNFNKSIAVPAGVAITILGRDAPLYLEEGDSIRLTASANSKIEAVASYELVG